MTSMADSGGWEKRVARPGGGTPTAPYGDGGVKFVGPGVRYVNRDA
jgi:hypothetical protein